MHLQTQSQICVYYPVAPFNDAYSNMGNVYTPSNWGGIHWMHTLTRSLARQINEWHTHTKKKLHRMHNSRLYHCKRNIIKGRRTHDEKELLFKNLCAHIEDSLFGVLKNGMQCPKWNRQLSCECGCLWNSHSRANWRNALSCRHPVLNIAWMYERIRWLGIVRPLTLDHIRQCQPVVCIFNTLSSKMQ